MTNIVQLSYNWTLGPWHSFPTEPGHSIQSPGFSDSTYQTEWFLQLYPAGISPTYSTHLSLYLWSKSRGHVKARWLFALVDTDQNRHYVMQSCVNNNTDVEKEKEYVFGPERTHFGFATFVPREPLVECADTRERLLPGGKLTILCQIWIEEYIPTEFNSQFEFTWSLSHFSDLNISYVESRNFTEPQTSTEWCLALGLPLNDINNNNNNNNEGQEEKYISLHLLKMSFEPVRVKVMMALVDCDGSHRMTLDFCHLFVQMRQGFGYPKFLPQNLLHHHHTTLLPHDQLTIYCLVEVLDLPSTPSPVQPSPLITLEEPSTINIQQEESFTINLQQDEPSIINLQQEEPSTINLLQEELSTINLQQDELSTINLQQDELSTINLQQDELSTINIQQDELSIINLQQDELSTSNLQQEEPSTTNLQQDELNTSTLQQDETSITNLQQDELNTSTLQQDETSTTNLQQDELNTSNLQQDETSTTNLQQEELSTINPQQDESSTINLKEDEPSTINLQQDESSTINLQQDDLSTNKLQQDESSTINLKQDDPSTNKIQKEELSTINLQQDEPYTPKFLHQEPKTSLSWTLEEFLRLPHTPGNFLETSDSLHHKWRLRVYPKGLCEANADYVSVELLPKTSGLAPVSGVPQCRISTTHAQMEPSKPSRTSTNSFLWPQFALRSSLESEGLLGSNGSLTLKCDLGNTCFESSKMVKSEGLIRFAKRVEFRVAELDEGGTLESDIFEDPSGLTQWTLRITFDDDPETHFRYLGCYLESKLSDTIATFSLAILDRHGNKWHVGTWDSQFEFSSTRSRIVGWRRFFVYDVRKTHSHALISENQKMSFLVEIEILQFPVHSKNDNDLIDLNNNEMDLFASEENHKS